MSQIRDVTPQDLWESYPEVVDDVNSTRPSNHESPYFPSNAYFTPRSPFSESQSASRFSGTTMAVANSPELQFLEHIESAPERTYQDEDKEAYQITFPVHHVNLASEKPIPKETVTVAARISEANIRRGRRRCLIGFVVLFVVIAIAVSLGTTFGLKKSRSSQASSTPQSSNSINSEVSVGGYIDPAYYSRSGAWNGTGIGLAAGDTDDGLSRFLFYQDYLGDIKQKRMSADETWDSLGSAIENSHKALNGTPLSVVWLGVNGLNTWHLFYVDEDYILRERILTNQTDSTWEDGPLSSKNLQTFRAETIGMTACYRGNYYRANSISATATPIPGLYIWFADSKSTMQQYSWSSDNDTEWTFEHQFSDIDGHTSPGCQTWLTGMTEYAFFVTPRRGVSVYWKDSNDTIPATAEHPIKEWTPVDMSIISGVEKGSNLGYTNFLVYQTIDPAIRGVNITWAAENTTIARTSSGGNIDNWILTDSETNQAVNFVLGSRFVVSAVDTASDSGKFLAFLQREGSDIAMYSRSTVEGAKWVYTNVPL